MQRSRNEKLYDMTILEGQFEIEASVQPSTIHGRIDEIVD